MLQIAPAGAEYTRGDARSRNAQRSVLHILNICFWQEVIDLKIII